MLRAAIAVGEYRPEAAERLFDVLWHRREKIARAYLDEVAPLERFRFEGDAMCFDDLFVAAGLAGDAVATYHARGAGPVSIRAGATRCCPLSRPRATGSWSSACSARALASRARRSACISSKSLDDAA